MMKKNLHSLLFATALCVVCSLLLTAASTGLKPLQQRNQAIDRYRNILLAFGILEGTQKVEGDRIEALYNETIRTIRVDAQGRPQPGKQDGGPAMPVYLHVKDEEIQAYAVPIDSPGLWGPIHGYMAFDEDGRTVRGFTVYQHQETPGLGGEIENAWFRSAFQGKTILDENGDFVSVRIAKGKVQDVVPPGQQAHYVDGISGATLTGKALTGGIRQTLLQYEPVSEKFRKAESDLYLKAE